MAKGIFEASAADVEAIGSKMHEEVCGVLRQAAQRGCRAVAKSLPQRFRQLVVSQTDIYNLARQHGPLAFSCLGIDGKQRVHHLLGRSLGILADSRLRCRLCLHAQRDKQPDERQQSKEQYSFFHH